MTDVVASSPPLSMPILTSRRAAVIVIRRWLFNSNDTPNVVPSGGPFLHTTNRSWFDVNTTLNSGIRSRPTFIATSPQHPFAALTIPRDSNIQLLHKPMHNSLHQTSQRTRRHLPQNSDENFILHVPDILNIDSDTFLRRHIRRRCVQPVRMQFNLQRLQPTRPRQLSRVPFIAHGPVVLRILLLAMGAESKAQETHIRPAQNEHYAPVQSRAANFPSKTRALIPLVEDVHDAARLRVDGAQLLVAVPFQQWLVLLVDFEKVPETVEFAWAVGGGRSEDAGVFGWGGAAE